MHPETTHVSRDPETGNIQVATLRSHGYPVLSLDLEAARALHTQLGEALRLADTTDDHCRPGFWLVECERTQTRFIEVRAASQSEAVARVELGEGEIRDEDEGDDFTPVRALHQSEYEQP